MEKLMEPLNKEKVKIKTRKRHKHCKLFLNKRFICIKNITTLLYDLQQDRGNFNVFF